MKTFILFVALVASACSVTAAPQHNPQPVRFVIVDHAPQPPVKFSKSTIWQYLSWLRFY